MPQNANFRLPHRHRFGPNFYFTGIALNHDGDPLGSILGQWVPIESKRRVAAVKFNMPQNSNFQLPRGHRFRPKFDFTVMAPNHGGDHPRVHLGANGVPLGPKMGQNRKKLPCLQIRTFHYPADIDFDQNST